MSRSDKVLAGSLLALAAALLLVGVVSGTIIRHSVQTVPALMAFAVALRGNSWNRTAALPILALWLLAMVLVWLYLLGLSRMVTGRFTTAEIILTIVIGVSCMVGLVAAFRTSIRPRLVAGIFSFLLFLGLQIGALWLSVRPAIEHR